VTVGIENASTSESDDGLTVDMHLDEAGSGGKQKPRAAGKAGQEHMPIILNSRKRLDGFVILHALSTRAGGLLWRLRLQLLDVK
jgi:hypothetical protein